jgi:ketose-bisphosphate aldolase
MPLESLVDLMARARRGDYAVGYFESWNLESLQGVLDAAEQTRSPVILGFNGDFLTRPDRLAVERIEWYGRMGLAAAQTARVPCGLIFNECPIDDGVRRAMECGFNIVSMADAAAEPADYVRRVWAIVSAAHAQGIGVEAEVGELPCAAAGSEQPGRKTTPDDAARFVEATGVDLLAVSVGNEHIVTSGSKGLDLAALADIGRGVSVPLVLHGGSGIAPESLKAAISLGVRKVNYGTYLKQRYLKAVRRALMRDADILSACVAGVPPASHQVNPHPLLGMGGPDDIMIAGRQAVRQAVLERIVQLGCAGKA